MTSVVIASAARTAVGKFLGGFVDTPAHDLGAVAISAAIERAGLSLNDPKEVIMGQILTAAQGQGPARQASIKAGLPVETPAWGINQLCGSGLRAVSLAAQQVQTGAADIVVAGGQESMSLAPHAVAMRTGHKVGDVSYVDTMIRDGLWDAFHGYHMGNTAENVARKWQIDRKTQDAFALASQNKAEAAQKAGRFVDEIAPVTLKTRKGEIVIETDEHIRHGATLESIEAMRPAFEKDGTVTAANASGLNDGAAALVVMSEDTAKDRDIVPMARIVAHTNIALDPSIMGAGPIYASRKVLDMAGWSIDDLDLIEANEAFAAQACAVNKDLGWDASKVNVNGGAIALGHPIGASGARILTTLLYEMQRRDAKKGLATLCIGGGMGVAMCVERD